MALLEALACGLPVVTTRVGENEAIVQEGVNGFLVPSGDQATLAQTINRLIASPALRQQLGANGRQASKRFDEKLTARRLIEMYDEVCSLSGHFS